ncbi:MAG: ABC-2 type transport system ATP-binding protein [Parcubacteria group bacterium Gr01-1014_13]|nr:MAG: ABC-2 type transport system ATP-binding protein [Parcubacteria group bacterium Gr01-1014_13]
MNMLPLRVNNVTKIFKNSKGQEFKAVDGVSLDIEPGKIFGLLGPNGAGKSTLINMISGILLANDGNIEVFGLDVKKDANKTKQLIGVVPQEIVMEMAFTVEEVLYYFCGMYGVPRHERKERIKAVLEDLGLADKIHEKARSLSGGMKRRLMIAKAILHKPKLLILDEPSAGVDVSLRQKIWSLVRRLNDEGTTIVFTTHYLEEAEQLCDSITLIDHGHVIKSGKLKGIQQEFSKNSIHFELFDRSVAPLAGVVEVGVEYEYPITTNLATDMAKLTSHYNHNLKSIRSEAASLEHIFLKLTNNGS